MSINYTFLLALILFFSNASCTQNNTNISSNQIESELLNNTDSLIELQDFTKEKVLKTLYSGSYLTELSKIKWKPYPAENIRISYDGYCYTNIDSIYYYSINQKEFALVVLRTITMYEGNDGGEMQSNADWATTGLAKFERIENNWVLKNFNRSVCNIGNFGEIPPVRMIDLNPNLKALLMRQQENHDSDVFEYIFSLDSVTFGNEIFSYPHFRTVGFSSSGELTVQYSTLKINKDCKEIEEGNYSLNSLSVRSENVVYRIENEEKQAPIIRTFEFYNNRYQLK